MFKKLLITSFAYILSISSLQALAVSLGDSVVLSNLGEAISAEIEILEWEDTDLSSLEVVLASEATFDAFGLVYVPVLNDLELEVSSPENGELKVLVSSQGNMSEPFLEMLILLRWPGGGVSREYILLFDPPVLDPPAQTVTRTIVRRLTPRVVSELPPMEPVVLEVDIEPEPVIVRSPLNPISAAETPQVPESIQIPELEPIPEPLAELDNAVIEELDLEPEIEELEEEDVEEEVEIEIEEETEAQFTQIQITIERRFYLVQESDSLQSIATQFQLDESSESLYQMLLGIFDLNPTAFDQGNIASLQAGNEIIIPGSEDIEAINSLTAQANYNELLIEGQALISREEAELIEELALVSNILPANTPPEEARFTPPPIENEVTTEPPELPGLPESQSQAPVQSSSPTVTELVPSIVDEALALTSSDNLPEPALSTPTTIENIDNPSPSVADENLSPREALAQNREQQRQDLENRVNNLKQQIVEVQTITLTLSNISNNQQVKQAEQQRVVNQAVYFFIGLALLLTLGLVLYVLRGKKS